MLLDIRLHATSILNLWLQCQDVPKKHWIKNNVSSIQFLFDDSKLQHLYYHSLQSAHLILLFFGVCEPSCSVRVFPWGNESYKETIYIQCYVRCKFMYWHTQRIKIVKTCFQPERGANTIDIGTRETALPLPGNLLYPHTCD